MYNGAWVEMYVQCRVKRAINERGLLVFYFFCVLRSFPPPFPPSGAVTFWPLAIYNPYAMYRKVYPERISPAVSMLMWFIWWTVLFVSVAATIGSMRNIITGFSTFKLFGQ